MIMRPAVRKLALTAHVVASVGWFGAVAVFLFLAIAGLSRQDPLMVRADYLVMESITWYVIVPLCLASVGTGLVSSLGTTLGLFRHYWVVVKLVMTVPSTIVLFIHVQPIGLITRAASHGAIASSDFGLQIQMVAAAAAALVVLLAATFVSVVKPRGLTPYGWRRQRQGLA